MITETHEGVQLVIKVTPKSKVNKIVGWTDAHLSIRITAPPEKGAANQALVILLSKEFQLPQKNIILLRGATSRTKYFLIIGLTKEKFFALLRI